MLWKLQLFIRELYDRKFFITIDVGRKFFITSYEGHNDANSQLVHAYKACRILYGIALWTYIATIVCYGIIIA